MPWIDAGVNPSNRPIPNASRTIGFRQLALSGAAFRF
jgi:hypothetical protein